MAERESVIFLNQYFDYIKYIKIIIRQVFPFVFPKELVLEVNSSLLGSIFIIAAWTEPALE